MTYRFGTLLSVAVVISAMPLASARAAAAQDAGLSKYEQGLVCKLGGTCDGAAAAAGTTDAAQNREVGGEATFNIYSGAKPAATAAAGSTAKQAAAPSYYKPAKSPVTPVSGASSGRSQPSFASTRAVAPVAGRKAADVQVLFANGSAELTPRGKEEVRAFANAIQSASLSSVTFVVEGHTNSVGARDYNLDLSQRRAQAVVDYLVQQGVPTARLQAKGFGFDKPRLKNAADGGNRRVEIVNAAN